MQLGYNSVLVTGRVDLRNELNAAEVERLMSQLGSQVREAVPAVHNIYLEPHAGTAARDASLPDVREEH